MSYKQLRSDLAEHAWDIYRERNVQFNQLESFPVSAKLKDEVKKAISAAFLKKMKEMSGTSKYAKAKELHIAEMKAKREYDFRLEDYEESKKAIFQEQMLKIDELNRQMWEELNILKNLGLYGGVLTNAENQVIEKFEEKKDLIKSSSEYKESSSARLDLLRARKNLRLAREEYESDGDENLEDGGLVSDESGDNSGKKRKKKNMKKVKGPIESLSDLNVTYQSTDDIILPTHGEVKPIEKGSGNQTEIVEDEQEYVDKINILFSKVLNTDNGFTPENYRVVVGKDSKDMVRKNSYVIVEIPGKNKTILVNNGYGEASFLCDEIFEKGELLKMSKDELLKQFGASIKKVKFVDEELWVEEIIAWLNETNNTDLDQNREEGETQELPEILCKLSIIMNRNYTQSSDKVMVTLRDLHKRTDEYFKLFFDDYSFSGNEDIKGYPHVDFNYLRTLSGDEAYNYKLKKLSALSDTMICEKLINENYYWEVQSGIEHYPFKNLGKSVVEKLLKDWKDYDEEVGRYDRLRRGFLIIVKNMEKFRSKETVVYKLLEIILSNEKKYGYLLDILLDNIDNYLVVEVLLSRGKDRFFVRNIDKFKKIDKKDKRALLESEDKGWFSGCLNTMECPNYGAPQRTLFDPEEDDPADKPEDNDEFWECYYKNKRKSVDDVSEEDILYEEDNNFLR